MRKGINNSTQIPYFYCDVCNKYIDEYYMLYDIGGTYYKCKCGREVYPIYPTDKELRKMKLERISE